MGKKTRYSPKADGQKPNYFIPPRAKTTITRQEVQQAIKDFLGKGKLIYKCPDTIELQKKANEFYLKVRRGVTLEDEFEL